MAPAQEKSWFGSRTPALWRLAVAPALGYINNSLLRAPPALQYSNNLARTQRAGSAACAAARRRTSAPPQGQAAGRAVRKPRPPEGESLQSNCWLIGLSCAFIIKLI